MEEQLFDLLEAVVLEASRLGAEFADVRVERTRFTSISSTNGSFNVSSGYDYGAAIRFYKAGSMGFAFTTRLTREAMLAALRRAASMASASGRGSVPRPVELGAAEDYYEAPVSRSVLDVDVDEKVSRVRALDKMLSESGRVKSRRIVYAERVEEKLYASTEGRRLGERRELVYLYASAFTQEAGVRASAHTVKGTIRGYEVWRKSSEEEVAKELLGRLEKQLRAKTPRPGSYPVVLAPEALGVFVHEAFGHLAEADLVVSGSVLRDKRGKQIASPLVTIVDDPGIEDGFGTLRYDDEGVRTAKAVIVERGVHRGVMTDRVHAALLGVKPTGNGRAESFRYTPLVRMRNTVMLPGDMSVNEVFEGIEFGYYVVNTGGGQTNLDGSFQVGAEEAYEIVQGEVGEPVRGLSIAGNTLETLLNVDAVAKDFQLGYGRCGKGQLVYVSLGGPHVRVKKMTVGGR